VSSRYGGPFHAGRLVWQGEAVKDEGGSIITPGVPEEHACTVQVDSVTEAMRAEAGYTDKDVRLIILAPGLGRGVDTDAALTVLEGPHAGNWMIAGQSLDTLAFAYDGRGRRV
jgi:hypothetical protein